MPKDSTPSVPNVTRLCFKGSTSQGWQVRMRLRGRAYSKYFGDRKYGTWAASLREAVQWRDEQRRRAGAAPLPGLRELAVRPPEATPEPSPLADRVLELERTLRERDEWIRLLEAEMDALKETIDVTRKRAMKNAAAVVRAATDQDQEAALRRLGVHVGTAPGSLTDVLERVEDQYADRMVLTRRARKSLRESPYADPPMALTAFDLLADVMYRHLAGEMDYETVSKAMLTKGIVYAPRMSEVTMGRYPGYAATWNGRPADMSRHLKLGTSRDPSHCMRIHFDWDESEQKIIVHHAGRHLPTRWS